MSLTDAYNVLVTSHTHMYEQYEQYMPLVFIMLCVLLILSKIQCRKDMHQLHKLENRIDSKRKALARERAELEYRYRILR